MNADTNIQVWLETAAHTPPGIIIPYVRTSQDKTLHYQVRAVRRGPAGRSMLSQGGVVEAQAGVPAALGRMSFNYGPADDCNIDLILSEHGSDDRNYHFACPD